jgi:hypothetical protein
MVAHPVDGNVGEEPSGRIVIPSSTNGVDCRQRSLHDVIAWMDNHEALIREDTQTGLLAEEAILGRDLSHPHLRAHELMLTALEEMVAEYAAIRPPRTALQRTQSRADWPFYLAGSTEDETQHDHGTDEPTKDKKERLKEQPERHGIPRTTGRLYRKHTARKTDGETIAHALTDWT